MNSVASAALASWTLDVRVIALLIFTAWLYMRGWIRGRRLIRTDRDNVRLGAFLAGLCVLFLATESPLDAFDRLFLSAHMTQHLLLLMVGPPLILLGEPVLPLLRGLPKTFVKEALGPFLTWPVLRRLATLLIAPPMAWILFAVSTICWHLPKFYELALQSPNWHAAQHASFFWTGILFWWPVVQPGPGKNHWPAWVPIPYLLLADILNTALSAFFVFSGILLYPSYQTMHAGGMSAQDDQILAGAIMWVPGSLIYLVPTFVFTTRLLSSPRRRANAICVRRPQIAPARSGTSRLPQLRRYAQFSMLVVAIAVIADGFFGTQVTPLNLAGVLPWIHWRALSLVALLAVGNLFCMVCPFTLVRDMGRWILPANRRWPRWLRTKWLPALLILVYLWAYEAFRLWDTPWVTAWIIVAYFTAALLIDGIFRGASFCKYVCPIGQFHFVSSLISPREVRVRDSATCNSCRTHDCIRGNERVRGCELHLFQPKKAGNIDCTFCMDCVKACPHDNVALLATKPASTIVDDRYRSSLGRLSKRNDFAALALLIVFGAFVNAAGMIDPVMRWEHAWHARIGAHAMPAIVAAFVFAGAVLLPVAAILVSAALNRLVARAMPVAEMTRRFVLTLVPIGVAMWSAHLLFHFVTGWQAPAVIASNMFAGVAHFPASTVPQWLVPLQILLLDAGLLCAVYTGWRIAKHYADRMRIALAIVAPWAALSCALYATGILILFQPMQMRGMMH